MLSSKYDVVDVSVTSTKPIVDCILPHPILDGTKKYSLEITEFATPLSSEPPLPLVKTFVDNEQHMFLFRVRRKTPGVAVINVNNELNTTQALQNVFDNLKYGPHVTFSHSIYCPTRTPNDLVFYLQEYFDEIKQVYINNVNPAAGNPGIDHTSHGGAPDVTPAQVAADSWVRVILTPNGTIKFYYSNMFCKHFWIETTPYAVKLFGLDLTPATVPNLVGGYLIAFDRPVAAGPILTGIDALVGPGGAAIVAGEPGETVVLQCEYPLIRHFDHRVRLEIGSSGMPVPAIIDWGTDNKQSVRHTIATFPINQVYETGLVLNTQGANTGTISFQTKMYLGEIVFRRAEDKVSERYELLNSQFFQNIRLEVFIIRREWDFVAKKFVFKRRGLALEDSESWTCKLRFRTF